MKCFNQVSIDMYTITTDQNLYLIEILIYTFGRINYKLHIYMLLLHEIHINQIVKQIKYDILITKE